FIPTQFANGRFASPVPYFGK
ncbi:hypothetical protein EVA_19454, partial [gut metagenome]